MKTKTLVAFLLCLIVPLSGQATEVHRCNGKIQFRPCSQNNSEADSVHVSVGSHPQRRERRNVRYHPVGGARVTQGRFKKVSPGLGLWTGRVSGSGKIHLRLNFVKNGAVVLSRYIGNVELTRDYPSTLFHFTSAMPHLTGWKWSISAAAS